MKLKFYLAFKLAVLIVIISCNSKKDDYLTKQERTIVGGLYFGMPKDSLESLVGTGLNKGYFQVNQCWSTVKDPTMYYYINSFDYSDFKIPNRTAHFGIVVPGFRNNRLSECHVFPVWAVDRDGSINQFANASLLLSIIPYQLEKSYGKDSSYYNEKAITTAIEANGYMNYEIPSMVHTYEPKFGKVEFVEGVYTEYIEWRNSEKIYMCWLSPMDSITKAQPFNYVKQYPCITYELDSKYYNQLGLNNSEL